jgi:hypothetical protein
MSSLRSIANTLLVVVAAAGCSSSSTISAEGLIGVEGGVVIAGDGAASIEIGEGAISTPTTISIESNSNPGLPSTLRAVGQAFTFGPEGAEFSIPITIKLAIDPGQIREGDGLVGIFTAPLGSQAFERLQTTVFDATHLSATVNHFSVFVPAVDVVPGGGEVDAGAANCVVACTTAQGDCGCQSSCDGTQYTMECFSGDGMFCNCFIDGAQQDARYNDQFQLSCPISALTESWTRSNTARGGCGFPNAPTPL